MYGDKQVRKNCLRRFILLFVCVLIDINISYKFGKIDVFVKRIGVLKVDLYEFDFDFFIVSYQL